MGIRRAKQAYEAGLRRPSRRYGGGLSVIPSFFSRWLRERASGDGVRGASFWAKARALVLEERVLVEGRHPGFDGAVVLDGAAAEEEPSGGKRGSAERQDRAGLSWRRVPEAELHARCAADKVVAGRHSAEERFDRGSTRSVRCSAQVVLQGFGRGELPSKVAAKRKLEVRRQARLHPGFVSSSVAWPQGRGAGRTRDRESGSVLGARVVSRLQKSERRIFPRGAVGHGATHEDPGRRG